MRQTSTIEYTPGTDYDEWPEVRHAAATHAREQRQWEWAAQVSSSVASIYATPAPDSTIGMIRALPKALRKQIRRLHGRVFPTAANALAQLQQQFTMDEIQLAALDDDGLLALAAAQAIATRTADGYTWNEPPGRPQHDRRFNMRQLRALRSEIIANLEIAAGLIGMHKSQTKYCGEETRRIREAAHERTADWMNHAGIVIPERDALGRIISEKIIPFAEAGNTRHKSYSEFLGFATALHELAAEEGRLWMMVTTNCPAHMHPSSPQYDGVTTPRQANHWLSKRNKLALDLLKKWEVDCAGVRTREPHQKAIPHSHSAIAHTARRVAEMRYTELVNALQEDSELVAMVQQDGKKRRRRLDFTLLAISESELLGDMSKEEFIDGMMKDIIECAFNRHFLDETAGGRDDGTGRLVKDVGVNIKHAHQDEGALFSSYVTTYIIKSFAVDYDQLPQRAEFESDDAHAEAVRNAVREQVEGGGDLAISAWASAHGIRTRELFGIPSRSPWKALGKMRKPIGDGTMETMRLAILENRHADYLRAQGGLNAPRKAATYRMRREVLPSNYILRPDMLRRRVHGVMRYESDTLTPDANMQPAAWHETHIEGCRIASNLTIKSKKTTGGDEIMRRSRTCTELPKNGRNLLQNTCKAPPPRPPTLH